MILRFFISLACVAVLGACAGPAYYLQAMSGQWKLMRAREDIQTLLNDPDTDAALAAQLQNTARIKAFAHDSLFLPGTDSYSSYVDVKADALVWNVVATEEFSLQAKKWCFPVAGCVPYRGYFKQEKARKFAARLQKKGMDVHIAPAAAYSSLGWFDDPLLSTMVSGSETRLAAYLFHELAHQRLYIKGDGHFNESYASFVQQIGVRAWLEAAGRQDELLKWQQRQSVGEDFTLLVREVRQQLSALYRLDLPDRAMRERKADVLNGLALAHRQLSKDKWDGHLYFSSWLEKPVNNARLALYSTYEGGHCAFQQLYDQAASDLQAFHTLAEQQSRVQQEDRERWLRQPCSVAVNTTEG